MLIAVPKELNDFEKRVALTPDVVQSLTKAGFEVVVEKDAGLNSFFDNSSYEKAGARILNSPDEVYRTADILLKVNPPSEAEIGLMKLLRDKESVYFQWMLFQEFQEPKKWMS